MTNDAPLRAVLVDDNPDDRALVKRELERSLAPIVTREVRDGAELQATLDEGEIDVVVTDYAMGWTNGVEVLKAVRAQFPDCPVVMFTGTGNEEVAAEALMAGLDDYVLKSHLVRLPGSIQGSIEVRRTMVERRRAGEALEESERRFRLLAENAVDVVYRMCVTPDGFTFDYISPSFLNVAGYAQEEAYANPRLAFEVVHVDDRELFERALRQPAAAVRLRWIHREGHVVWTDHRTSIVRDVARMPVAIEGIARDVSGLVAVEEELRSSNERFGLVARATNDAVWDWAVENDESWWNYRLYEVLGYRPGDILPGLDSWSAAIHPDDRDAVLRSLHESLGGRDDSWVSEYRQLRRNGSQTHVIDRRLIVRDENGKPARVVGAITDVTEGKAAEEQLAVRARQQAVVSAIGQAALAGTDVQDLMERAVLEVADILGVENVSVLELAPERDELLVRAGIGWRSGVVGRVIPLGDHGSPASLSITTGESVIVDHLETDDRFIAPSILLEHGVIGGMTSIIQGRDRTFGVLAAYSVRPRTFSAQDVAFNESVANVLAAAIERLSSEQALADRAEDLSRLAEQRQWLLDALVSAQEDERARVARELHDGLGQVLTSLALFATDLSLGDMPEEQRQKIKGFRERVQKAIGDMRQLVWSLRPVELDDEGLVAALRRLVSQVREHDGVEADLLAEVGADRLPPSIEATVYRVVQEAITNALRHGSAGSISVVVTRRGGTLTALVEDDGRGFDASSDSEGFGLLGMRERASLIGGTVLVDSALGRGTTIRLEVPLGR